MAIVAIFDVKGATVAKYEDVLRRLAAKGMRVPDGQLYHIAYGDKNNLQVIDVFENQAKLDAFGAALGPILQEMGIAAKPSVFVVHNIVEN